MNSRVLQRLSPGWQATLSLHRYKNGVRLSKAFGVGCGWTRDDAVSISQCARRYSQWLAIQGVPVLRNAEEQTERRASEWLYVVTQPYLGPDCDARLTRQGATESESQRIMEQLIRIGLRVAFPTQGPLFRGEVKPRDFCLAADGALVLIDSFPPVLAKKKRTFVVATRRTTRSCIVPRERDEVLAITGSPVGILRNMCEHLLSTSPAEKELILSQVFAVIEAACPRTSSELATHLNTKQSVHKIAALAARRS